MRRNLEADGRAAPWVLQERDGEHREEQEGAQGLLTVGMGTQEPPQRHT